MSDEDYQRGVEVRRSFFGKERTDASLAGDTALEQSFQKLVTAYCFGSLWGQEGVALRDRSLMTMCLVAGQHRFAELETHMKLALRNGCEPELLIEVVRHIAVYCGVPSGFEAFRIAQRVLAENEAGKAS